MKPKFSPTPSLLPDAKPVAQSASWNEHEHVSEHVQSEAQKLVELVGSPELAKNAIDVAGQGPVALPSIENTPPVPTPVKRNEQFLKALEDFETSLETPVMAGDLIGWVTTVGRACEQLGVLLRDDVQRQHTALFATISRQDPELASRVEQLQATDEQLAMVDFSNVQSSLKQLLAKAESAERDELKAAKLCADVVKQALAFVIGVRTQETAIVTWFGEAFNRDSGIGG